MLSAITQHTRETGMDDTTLLNLAGKAAGENYGPDNTPIERDDLALRLAVKLGITMYPAESVGDCATTTFPDGKWVTVESSGDPLADLRRAIVLAAAEIGKAMP
jgi:hypothetical protein